MSLKSKNKSEANTYELEIEINAEDFEAAVQAAFIKARGKISIPGFRQGKAPRKMIEKLYGEGTFYDDAVNQIIPSEIAKVIESENLEVVDRPEVEVVSVDKENGLVFKATCIVKPEVEISAYRGINVTRTVKAVTDEDISAEIDKIRNKNARLITIEDRETQNGDDVLIDFEGFIDNVAFEGGAAEGFHLSLGSGQFIPGFEEQVVGHKIGEEFDVNVSFPEDYQMAEIAGKPAVFKIKLHEIKAKELPEVDDDFVKDTTEFESIDALKSDMMTKMTAHAEEHADSEVENAIFEAVMNATTADIPQVMFDKRVSEMVQEFSERLESQGMNMDLYLQYTGMDKDAFKKTFEERAKKEVLLRLALEKIANLENFEVTDEDLEAEFVRLSEMYTVSVEEVKKAIPADALKKDIVVSKAAELVKSEAKIS